MIGLLILHAVLGCGVLAAGRRLGQWALILGGLGPAAASVWLAWQLPGVTGGRPLEQHVEWLPELGIGLDFRLDGYSVLFAALVAGIGVLVFVYSARYLPRRGVGVGRLAGLLTLFAGSMLGLVLADDLFVLYGFWELTSVTSYLLIGHDHENRLARAAALQALLVTSSGALAMLGGFVMLGQAAGTFRISELVAEPPTGGMVTVAIGLVLLGALTKSAQYPFHAWLPGAMVASTPVSTYLHSATMVKAGVFLVGRLAPAFVAVDLWRPALAGIGLVTMVAAGWRALGLHDLKLLLAHGTISQLGFMMALLGLGTEASVLAGCVVVLAHGLFKAALFMVVGMLEHQTGTRDLRKLPVLGREWRTVKVITVVSAASMAGVPLAFGFVAKEEALAVPGAGGFAFAGLVLVAEVIGSVLTVAYSLRFARVIVTKRRRAPAIVTPAVAAAVQEKPPAPATLLVAPAALLAAMSVLLGVAPALADRLVDAAVESLLAGPTSVHLVVWHGFDLVLWLTVLVLAAGTGLFLARDRLATRVSAPTRLPSADAVFLSALRGLNRLADRVTAVVQPGSLPIYAGIILLTTAGLVGGTLVLRADWPGWPELAGVPGQVPVAFAIVVLAVAAARAGRRFSAALFLGATGYAMAGLFVIQGAPDLALTQVAIETLTTVLFVLVLRRLPGDFEHQAPQPRRLVRLAVAGAVAAAVFGFAIVAAGGQHPDAVSQEMVERSLPDGGGRNVVNVILVDFRALDTLGEITVLTAASIGAVALARAGRRQPASSKVAK
jgi:multicomponent Na+:H+ antiporter subunit A